MSDIVVTVPRSQWPEWLAEGDLAGTLWTESWYHFWLPRLPRTGFVLTSRGAGTRNRCYIVAGGRLRGYAPIIGSERVCTLPGIAGERACVIRGGNAVAVTIDQPIRGFQGFRYRWWDREDEVPFPDWQQL